MKKILIFIFILALHTQYASTDIALTDSVKDPRTIGDSWQQQKIKNKKFQICLFLSPRDLKYSPYLTKKKECGSAKHLLINSLGDYDRYWVSYFESSDQRKCIYGDCHHGEGILVIGNYHYNGKFVDGYYVGKEIYNFIDGEYFYFDNYYNEVNKEDWKVSPLYDEGSLFPDFEISGIYYKYLTKSDRVYDYDNLLTEEKSVRYKGGFYLHRYHGQGFVDDIYNKTTFIGNYQHGKIEGNITWEDPVMIVKGNYSQKNATLSNAIIEYKIFEDYFRPGSLSLRGNFKTDGSSYYSDELVEIRIVENINNQEITTKYFGNIPSNLIDIQKQFIPLKKEISGNSDNKLNFTYEGDLKNFYASGFDYLLHGKGLAKYGNGAVYKGEFKQNLRDGFGIYKYPNGDIYTGEFRNNTVHGQGKMVYANGEVYDGKWEFGQPLLKSKTDKKYYALVIGNNNYQNLENLDAAVNDAKVISKILEDKYDFDVNLLVDADYETTVNTFYRLSRQLKKDDNFLIFYAGHGHLDKKQNRGYWLPTDANPDLPSKWISNALIADELKATEAKHVLLIVDSCFSGSLMRSSDNLVKEQSLDDKYIKLLENKKTRLVISSGGNEPVLDSDGGDHSVFARKLIDTLKENKNVISTQQIFENIRKYVFSNAKQTPERAAIYKAGHDGGDFLFFAN